MQTIFRYLDFFVGPEIRRILNVLPLHVHIHIHIYIYIYLNISLSHANGLK